MKRTLPLLAVLAATLAAPVAAQDISSILNPGNFAARLNAGNSAAFANLPSDMSGLFQGANAATRLNPAMADRIAMVAPSAIVGTSRLAPVTSMAPIPRGSIARIVTPVEPAAATIAHVAPVAAPERGTDLVAMMADAAEAAPSGANTLVVSGGTNTAVIQSGPSEGAPRLTLWQRLFGI